ncbi:MULTISPECIES: acyl carrier protein [unclassified Corynebacterium]|uniref:acyl carrier protein n=1 Tax=unclassified Corynebacterium TaxID=2624378 RepID=UPI00165257A9|nr:acyl carrier protein [Corynebacterium sp. LK33]MBC6821094.1 acyl carrier protein [Corynebacterium sp. LK33]
MTSSLGDQLSALLGTQVTGARDADDANAANAGSKKGSADADLPAGLHGEVAAIVKKMANDAVESLELPTPLTDYGFDRLSVVELAVRCEEELGVRIEDEDIPSFKTLGDVVDYIAARRG